MDIVGQAREFRVEACRYFFGSARSRWRQNALLRELELHHLVDIGIDPFTMQRTAPTFTLRPATEADMESVQRIYGDHVAHGLASFEEAPPSVEEMLARFRTLKGQSFPYIVAERQISAAIPMPGPIARARPIVSPSRIPSMSIAPVPARASGARFSAR